MDTDKKSFTLPPEDVAALQRSIREAERGEVVDGWELLSSLEAMEDSRAGRTTPVDQVRKLYDLDELKKKG